MRKRYERKFIPPITSQRITTSVEFFIDRKDQIMLYYNDKLMSFYEFLKLKESKLILEIMYNHIIQKIKVFEPAEGLTKIEAIIQFIREYFTQNKPPLDIFIKNSGELEFNFDS
jgi:hypothetical protein